MAQKVNIIGAGIAGLCTASFLQDKGFETEIFESHKRAGGLMTYWNRGEYRIETCIHWLIGSHKDSAFYPFWNKVLDMEKLEFHNYDVYNVFEDKHGNVIRFFTNVDKLEEELLTKAPEDTELIKELTNAIRKISKFRVPLYYGDTQLNFAKGFHFFKDNFSLLGEFNKWSKISESEFASHLKNPLLKEAIEYLFMPDMAMIFIIFSLAWMNNGHAGYPIGGSYAMTKLLEQKLIEKGGKISYKSNVSKVLVENDKAIGLVLEDKSVHYSDFVVSAADGMQTFDGFLSGKYNDDKIYKRFKSLKIFPSYLQVSLGIRNTFDEFYSAFNFEMEKPLHIDNSISINSLAVRLHPYDPTFSPAGASLLSVFLPTYNFSYWHDLRSKDPATYAQEKERVLNAVIEILQKKMKFSSEEIEMRDISTPASVYRYTRNYNGSMEGWLMTPKEGFSTLPQKIKKLDRFYLAGQWVSPGGGLPAGLITGFEASKLILKESKRI